MPTTQSTVAFADADGETASTTFYFDGVESDPSTGATDDLVTALKGLSTGAVVGVTNKASDFDLVGTAASNAYDAADKLVFFGRSALGEDVQTSVPAPLSTVFNANKETVNLASGAGATIKAALEAAWVGPSGSPVTVLSAERMRYTRKR